MVKVIETKGKDSKELEKEIFKLTWSKDKTSTTKMITSINSISDDRLVIHITEYPIGEW